MHATHINAYKGSLLRVLGTTMQVGHGPVPTLCTARAQRAKRPPWCSVYQTIYLALVPSRSTRRLSIALHRLVAVRPGRSAVAHEQVHPMPYYGLEEDLGISKRGGGRGASPRAHRCPTPTGGGGVLNAVPLRSTPFTVGEKLSGGGATDMTPK